MQGGSIREPSPAAATTCIAIVDFSNPLNISGTLLETRVPNVRAMQAKGDFTTNSPRSS